MKDQDSQNIKNKQELEEQLVRDNYGLVVSQALSFLSDNKIPLEDYIQAGLIGLLKSIRKFEEKKSKFSTFASVCIKNEMLNLKRKNKKDLVIFNDDLVSINHPEYMSSNFFEYLPDCLTEEDKFIIKLKLTNHTNSEIADFLSCSKSTVSNKIRRIIKVIKESN
jgi:RNA polymerase sigma factor (sigma-70 family)